MIQPLFRTISESWTCLLKRTQQPAIASARRKYTSNELPCSDEAGPPAAKPKTLSHAEGGLEQAISNQRVGSQSARLTLGFSLMSRRKRKTTSATVRKRTRIGGKWRPKKLAIVGEMWRTISENQMSDVRGRRTEEGG